MPLTMRPIGLCRQANSSEWAMGRIYELRGRAERHKLCTSQRCYFLDKLAKEGPPSWGA